MQRLIEAVKRAAAEGINSTGTPRWGVVTSVKVSQSGVYVRASLQPEDTMTGWLPVTQCAAGGNMTVLTVPEPGWQAFVIPDLGHAEHGVVVGFSHSDAVPMPTVPDDIGAGGRDLAPGETLLMGPGGAVFLRLSAGVAYLKGNLHVEGDIVASGDISDHNSEHETLADFRSAYDAHKHSGVQSGSAVSGTTDHAIS